VAPEDDPSSDSVLPPDSDVITLGNGTDLATSERIRFVVPPEAVLDVLATLQDGRTPDIEVHEFDVVDWTVCWEET
jgi:hypothetical protein